MGLHIHSLGRLPIEIKKDYYVFLLDYGWNEPLGNALKDNFEKMAEMASLNNAVVMKGVQGCHFEDEVLSWYNVNGLKGEEILPAILITTVHPGEIKEGGFVSADKKKLFSDNIIVIPLRDHCKNTTDVAVLINNIFNDIESKKMLKNFTVINELSKGKNGAVVDSLILQPNFMGIGLNLNKLLEFFRK